MKAACLLVLAAAVGSGAADVQSKRDAAAGHVRQGLTLSKAGRVDEAEAEFEKALADDSKNAEALYMLGLLYEKKGLKESAAEMWKACESAAAAPAMKETARRHLHLLAATKR